MWIQTGSLTLPYFLQVLDFSILKFAHNSRSGPICGTLHNGMRPNFLDERALPKRYSVFSENSSGDGHAMQICGSNNVLFIKASYRMRLTAVRA